jgi:hypothetical protein
MGIFDQPAGSPAFGFNQIGARVQGYVVAEPTVKPQMKFDGSGKPTDIPDTWTSGDPKMKVIIQLQTQLRDPEMEEDDGVRGVYAVISNSEGSCFRAIKDAIKAAGRKDIEVGGFLDVWYAGDDPKSSNPRNPRKLYGAQYQPPATPLASQPPAAPPVAAPVAAPPAAVAAPAPAPAVDPAYAAWQAEQQRAAQVAQAQAHFPNAPVAAAPPAAAPAPGLDFAAMAAALQAGPPQAAPAAPAPVAAPPAAAPGQVEIDPATMDKVRALIGAGIDTDTIVAATGLSAGAVAAVRGLG